MSARQEVLTIHVWGFVEVRGRTAEVIEVYANTTEEFAVLDATERALEAGFSTSNLRSPAPVLTGADDLGGFEVRTFAITHAELRGADELFTEANELADAAARVVALPGSDGGGGAERTQLEAALARYDGRWGIRRGRS